LLNSLRGGRGPRSPRSPRSLRSPRFRSPPWERCWPWFGLELFWSWSCRLRFRPLPPRERRRRRCPSPAPRVSGVAFDMFSFRLAGRSRDGGQPPAFGRGCRLDRPFSGSPAFWCRGVSATRCGTGGKDPWTREKAVIAHRPGLAGISAASASAGVRLRPPKRSAAAKKLRFGRRRAAGWVRGCLTPGVYAPWNQWQGANRVGFGAVPVLRELQ